MKREADGDMGSPQKRTRRGDEEVRLLIPSKVAGSIIGKGGQNITKLRSQYKASITVPDCPGPERMLTLSSDVDTICNIVGDVIPNLEENGSTTSSNELDLRMMIHQSQAGCVIGKAGSKIKEIRDKTGARIKIFSSQAPQSSDRIIQIIGEPAKCIDTIREVISLTKQTPIKGVVNPYDPHNFDEMYAEEYGGWGGTPGGHDRRRAGPGGGPGGGGNFRNQSRGPPGSGGPRGGGSGGGNRGGPRFGGAGGGGGGGGRREEGSWGPPGGGGGNFDRGNRGGGNSGSGGGGMGGGNFMGGPFGGGNRGGGGPSGPGGGSFGGGGGSGGGSGGGGSGGGRPSNGGGPGPFNDRVWDVPGGNNFMNRPPGGGGSGGGGGGVGGPGNLSQGGPPPPPPSGQNQHNGMDNGNRTSTQVTIPKDLAGAIIGKGGGRIRKIRQDSGAGITIDEPLPGSNDRIITISGTPNQIQMAQYLLQQSVHNNADRNNY